MGAKEEATVKEFCDLWGDGQSNPDAERLLSLMSKDAVWVSAVPLGKVFKGQAAIREEIVRISKHHTPMKCGTFEMVSTDRIVFTERLDFFSHEGKRVNHALVAVYEIDKDGLISVWREYFDTTDVAQQMGLSTANLFEASV